MMFVPGPLSGRDLEPGSPRPWVRFIAIATCLASGLAAYASEQPAFAIVAVVALVVAHVF